MHNNTFNDIWKTTMQLAVSLTKELNLEIFDKAKITILESQRNLVKNEYDRIKANLKKNYYRGNSKKSLICHHKIASCYCNALVIHKVIKFDIKQIELDDFENQKKVSLLNYKLAFLAGLSIIYYYLLEYYEKSNTITEKEREYAISYLIEKGMLEFPAVNDTHDTFLEGVIKMVGIQNLNNDKFDTLGFSYIYYFIEEHNKSIIQKNHWIGNLTDFEEYIETIDQSN